MHKQFVAFYDYSQHNFWPISNPLNTLSPKCYSSKSQLQEQNKKDKTFPVLNTVAWLHSTEPQIKWITQPNMIMHSEDGLKYDVQWSIKTIQTTQHVKYSDQLNITGAELGPAQPQLVSISWGKCLKQKIIVLSDKGSVTYSVRYNAYQFNLISIQMIRSSSMMFLHCANSLHLAFSYKLPHSTHSKPDKSLEIQKWK